MLLINEKQGYTVCLECHEVCRGACSREWLEEHTRHTAEELAEVERRGRRSWALGRRHLGMA